MRFVNQGNITDPHLNLALEEYLLREGPPDESLFLTYVNEPAVVVGRNQNMLAEVDPLYLEGQAIHLVRRLSGGGAVYHDTGNLNYSFIMPGQEYLHRFDLVTEPVRRFLAGLGVRTELRDRSSIFTGNKKISGNAQYASRGRLLTHGTLLYDSDLDQLRRAIRPRQPDIQSRAVQSVRSAVTNIRPLLTSTVTLAAFAEALRDSVLDGSGMKAYSLEAHEWLRVRQLAEERYRSWAWNAGRCPPFRVKKERPFNGRVFAADIEVVKGRIESVRLTADQGYGRGLAALEEALRGVRYDARSLSATLQLGAQGLLDQDLTTAQLLDLLY